MKRHNEAEPFQENGTVSSPASMTLYEAGPIFPLPCRYASVPEIDTGANSDGAGEVVNAAISIGDLYVSLRGSLCRLAVRHSLVDQGSRQIRQQRLSFPPLRMDPGQGDAQGIDGPESCLVQSMRHWITRRNAKAYGQASKPTTAAPWSTPPSIATPTQPACRPSSVTGAPCDAIFLAGSTPTTASLYMCASPTPGNASTVQHSSRPPNSKSTCATNSNRHAFTPVVMELKNWRWKVTELRVRQRLPEVGVEPASDEPTGPTALRFSSKITTR